MRQPKLIDYILLTVLALIWASAFFNIKIATYSFGPVTIAFLRVFFGAIPVLLLCYYKNIKIEAFLKRLVLVCNDRVYKFGSSIFFNSLRCKICSE